MVPRVAEVLRLRNGSAVTALRMTVLVLLPFALQAQDTTQAYPWRLSYFPYLTASPNDGVMAMGRVLFFRQSRWDDRVSLHSSVAIEGGYSTKDSWVARVRGDFPRIADGWRLQAILQANRTSDYLPGAGTQPIPANERLASLEVSRKLGGPFLFAMRGEMSHVDLASAGLQLSENDTRVRLAIVVDQRDREYDTRSGTLIQGGVLIGSSGNRTDGGSFTIEYGTAAAWATLSPKTRVTGRVAARFGRFLGSEASRMIPAWEDEFLVVGGPESNRGVPIAAETNDCVALVSGEVRHDVKVFPGGAFSVVGFVDGGQASDCGRHTVSVALRTQGLSARTTGNWIFSPGVGISLRLLRNAILTATVAHAQGATRVYVSSGWSW